MIQIRHNLLAVILVVAGSGPICAQSVDDISLSVTLVGTDLIDPVAWGPNKTIRVWAELPSGWRLDAVAGNDANPMSIEVMGGSFYQDAFGGPTSFDINAVLFSLQPSLEWDTFLTIGALTVADNELSQIGMEWDDFESGNPLAINNGSIFVVPTAPQGELQAFTDSCGQTSSGVLIGQFTLLGEGASLMCSVLLQGKDESGAVWQQPIAIDASTDCNSDGILDACQIDASTDCNGNGLLDTCDLNDGEDDCNGDGTLDACQIDSSTDCNGNGLLDTCDLNDGEDDCNDDGILDVCQIDASTDCNGDGTLDACQIDASTDCNGNGLLDTCDLNDGEDDCNGDGTLDACQIDSSTDCNGNGLLDTCDLNDGQDDCNDDGILDACQIDASTDCNGDGTLDACQIDASTDCNGDGVLDACQCVADIDQSGVVDVLDLLFLLEAWAEDGCADLSGDAIVGVEDLVLLINAWGVCEVE